MDNCDRPHFTGLWWPPLLCTVVSGSHGRELGAAPIKLNTPQYKRMRQRGLYCLCLPVWSGTHRSWVFRYMIDCRTWLKAEALHNLLDNGISPPEQTAVADQESGRLADQTKGPTGGTAYLPHGRNSTPHVRQEDCRIGQPHTRALSPQVHQQSTTSAPQLFPLGASSLLLPAPREHSGLSRRGWHQVEYDRIGVAIGVGHVGSGKMQGTPSMDYAAALWHGADDTSGRIKAVYALQRMHPTVAARKAMWQHLPTDGSQGCIPCSCSSDQSAAGQARN